MKYKKLLALLLLLLIAFGAAAEEEIEPVPQVEETPIEQEEPKSEETQQQEESKSEEPQQQEEETRYTITFTSALSGQVLYTQEVVEGETPEAPSMDKQTEYNGDVYFFEEWNPQIAPASANATYTAQYSIAHLVRFVDDLSGTQVQIGKNQYIRTGKDAEAPDTESDSFPTHTGYAFNGWSVGYKNVQQDLTVVAQWLEKRCTVSFYDGLTGKLLSTETVAYGASLSEIPDAPDHSGYTQTSLTIVDTDGSAASLNAITKDITATYKYSPETEQTVSLGKYTIASVKPSETVTLAFPLVITDHGTTYYTNCKAGSSTLLPYSSETSFAQYDQTLAQDVGIRYCSLDFDFSAASDLPFTAESISATANAILRLDEDNAASYGGSVGDSICLGYAVFEDLQLKANASLENGYYKLPMIATWQDAEGNICETTLEAQIQVKGVKTSSGGGYSGSSSSIATPTANPTAKLIVESIKTIPETPLAGDTFDIVLTLHNTSETLYLQNMELQYSAEDDAILPVSGSNLEYIPLIAANSTYEKVLHVKSMPDLTKSNIKLTLEMSFEDKNLNTLSAAQTMIVNVKQVQKITLDELVLPTGQITENSSCEISMGVYNAGQTTLYNVTAHVTCEDANLSTGSMFFAGNMESGTSKTIELETIPMAAGDYSGSVILTYETIDGEVTTCEKPFTFTANAEESYDYYDDSYLYEYTDESMEETTSLADFLSRLNPMAFAAFGGAMFIAVLAAGAAAKSKRKRSFEEDEMD